MLIQVTREDIARGLEFSCQKCPVARAVRRAARRQDVRINTATWEARDAGGPLPEIASRFIDEFDRGLSVKPFEFELDLPEAG